MENILVSSENALNYLDDVIVFGQTESEHDRHLEKVLSVFKEYNVTLNERKCLRKIQ